MSNYVKFKLTYDGHIMIDPVHIIGFQDLDNGESLICIETKLRCDSHRVAHTAEKIDKMIDAFYGIEDIVLTEPPELKL
jgi:hypothetical protein